MLNIFRKKKNKAAEDLKKLLTDFDLPSFPAAVMNVLSILRNPDSSISDTVQTVQVDPGMLVRVLQMVNSAAFGLSSAVSNIRHAVTLLGKSRLEAIVLSLALKEALPHVHSACLDSDRFWLSSARRASLARALAEHLHPQTQSEAFTAGLLQDIAVPVLAKFKGNQYGEILDNWYADHTGKLEVLEKELLGYDHQRIGALIAQEWKFPPYLIASIAGHHGDITASETEPATKLVSFIRDYDDPEGTKVLVRVCEAEFGFSKQKISQIINKTSEDAEGLSQMLR